MNLYRSLFRSAFTVVTVALVVSCTSKKSTSDSWSPSGDREPAAVRKETPELLTDKQIQRSASSGVLRVEKSHVIIDNDEAFFSKYNAIDSAQEGDTIRMVYYIFSGDESSSYLTEKLIEKAKSGVKVKLLVDLITNYKNLDLLSYIEKAGNGNIEVALYGRPSSYVMRDALFMTKPCPVPSAKPSAQECSNAKWSEVEKIFAGNKGSMKLEDFYMNLFLAGLYARDGASAKIGLTIGSQLAATQSQTGPISDKQKKELRDLVKLVLDAKVFGKDSAYIKLALAMVLYANEVNPVLNQLYGRFPFEQPDKQTSYEHWEHLTDYTHHKLLLVGNDKSDSAFMTLGGRNIENSYHMKLNNISAKYTFMDTDFAAQVTRGAKQIVDSYDKMWRYGEVVVTLKELKSFLNNDFARNPQALMESVALCTSKGLAAQRDEMAKCLATETVANKNFKNLDARLAVESASMKKNSDVYVKNYLSKLDRGVLQSWKGKGYQAASGLDSRLSAADESSAAIYYLENLPFTRNSNQRTLNFDVGAEYDNNKNIHDLWLKGLQSVCASGKPERVILHSAYWFPATNMMETFRKMIDGTWDCSKVQVQIVTNSVDTTDLNVLNMFARYQMNAFYSVYDSEYTKANRKAKFEYYEYRPGKGASEKQILSLHTKMSILGDDVIIGSANADIRSYMMDTNNGVFIRGAKDFVRDYTAWLDGVLKDPKQVVEISAQFRQPLGFPTQSEKLSGTPLSKCTIKPILTDKGEPIYLHKNHACPLGQPQYPGNLHGQDMCGLDGLAIKYSFVCSLKQRADDWKQLQELERALAFNIWESTYALMSDKYWEPQRQSAPSSAARQVENKIRDEKTRIKNDFNRKYQTF